MPWKHFWQGSCGEVVGIHTMWPWVNKFLCLGFLIFKKGFSQCFPRSYSLGEVLLEEGLAQSAGGCCWGLQ